MSTNPSAFGILNNPVTVAQGGTGQTTLAGSQSAILANLLPWWTSDSALLAQTGLLDGTGGTFVPTAGTVYLHKVIVRAAFTWTTVNYIISSAGVGASTGSFVGLYSSAGTLLSGSSDVGAALTGTGNIASSLTSAQALSAGTFVWVAFLCNLATTQPTLRAWGAPAFAVANVGLAAATFRCATNGTGLTALPASITPGSNVTSGNTVWFGAT